MRWKTWYSAVLGLVVGVAVQIRCGLQPTPLWWKTMGFLALGVVAAAILTAQRKRRRR